MRYNLIVVRVLAAAYLAGLGVADEAVFGPKGGRIAACRNERTVLARVVPVAELEVAEGGVAVTAKDKVIFDDSTVTEGFACGHSGVGDLGDDFNLVISVLFQICPRVSLHTLIGADFERSVEGLKRKVLVALGERAVGNELVVLDIIALGCAVQPHGVLAEQARRGVPG